MSSFSSSCFAWRDRIAWLALIALVAAVLALPALRSELWQVRVADSIVGLTFFLGGGWALISLASVKGRGAEGKKHNYLLALFAVITIFATYAAFRNQGRLSSEQGLSVEGQRVADLEYNTPQLRCLYDNFAYNDITKCMLLNTKDAEAWSMLIFYVEDIIWILEKSKTDEQIWGSYYSEDIDYWRDYVNADVTGFFSYYLHAYNVDERRALEQMKRSGIFILGSCGKYRSIRRLLVARRANPDKLKPCSQLR